MQTIAIVTPNTLMAIGLKHVIQQMMPALEVRLFMQWADVDDHHKKHTAHFFVDEQCINNEPEVATQLPPHTIILITRQPDNLIQSTNLPPHSSSTQHPTLTLCVQQTPQKLQQSLLQLMRRGHFHAHRHPDIMIDKTTKPLTSREKEILVCVVKGMINKEIAEFLHISHTTVITHRKNITQKLNIKSAAGLTLFAVLNGIVDPQEVLAR